MAKGIIIFGPAGSGKTTLGKEVAKRLNYPYFDIDDVIWKKTAIPFTEMYTKDEKIHLLMEAISHDEHFVMAGSMSSFHEYFDPFFELGVHLYTDVSTRKERVHQRELKRFGSRILEGGDMYEEHQRFLNQCENYETDGLPSQKKHLEWAELMPCPVIYLDGIVSVEINAKKIVETYQNLKNI